MPSEIDFPKARDLAKTLLDTKMVDICSLETATDELKELTFSLGPIAPEDFVQYAHDPEHFRNRFRTEEFDPNTYTVRDYLFLLLNGRIDLPIGDLEGLRFFSRLDADTQSKIIEAVPGRPKDRKSQADFIAYVLALNELAEGTMPASPELIAKGFAFLQQGLRHAKVLSAEIGVADDASPSLLRERHIARRANDIRSALTLAVHSGDMRNVPAYVPSSLLEEVRQLPSIEENAAAASMGARAILNQLKALVEANEPITFIDLQQTKKAVEKEASDLDSSGDPLITIISDSLKIARALGYDPRQSRGAGMA